MGVFGFGDFNKVGPGVDKDQPQKRSGVVFFEVYFRKFWDLIVANLLFVLVSLPVVTAGLGSAGLAYITRNFSREQHAFVASDFFDIIKKNWKQALISGILELVVGALIGFAVWFYYSGGMYIVFAFALAMALVFICMRYYLYMLMVTFDFTLKQLYKNSMIMALVCWKPNLLISVVLGALYALGALLLLGLQNGIAVVTLIAVWVLLFPAFRAYLIQFCIFPSVKALIIDPYYAEHKGEDIDKIKALGIAVDEPKNEEEVIFEDRGNEVRAAEEEAEKKAAWQFPAQYSEAERRRHRSGKAPSPDDDDDTI